MIPVVECDLTMLGSTLVLKTGDAIRLRAANAKGESMLRNGNVWTVLRVEPIVLALNLAAGVLIKQDKEVRWLAFTDPNVYIEPCHN